jgi:hypothetical protein
MRTQPKTYELEPKQVEALDLLLSGSTVTEAAAALDLARETVSRWRNRDPAFIAAHNAALQSAWDATHGRLVNARGKAIDRLADLLDSEDQATALRAAVALVRLDLPRPRGDTDPVAIESTQRLLDTLAHYG